MSGYTPYVDLFPQYTVRMLSNSLSKLSVGEITYGGGISKTNISPNSSANVLEHPPKVTGHARASFINNIDGVPTRQARMFNGRVI
jgi:hypothetical protein